MKITFAVASNDRSVLERNFLASPALSEGSDHEILIQENYRSAALAYNAAIDRSQNDLIAFIHQDVYLPGGWLQRLESCIAKIEAKDRNWGLIGCFGTTQDGREFGHIYTPRFGAIGSTFESGREVQTLDEVVLIVRKSSGLRFNGDLPHFHLYGADICLRARSLGMRSYAVAAFCIHNSNYLDVLPPEFYECCQVIKRTWRQYLPIQTACIRMTRFDLEMRRRQLREAYIKLTGRMYNLRRVDDPASLFEQTQPKALSLAR